MHGIEWLPRGDHYVVEIDGEVIRCVSCRKPLEHALRRVNGVEKMYCSHKCSVTHENRRQGASRAQEEPIDRDPPFGQRLTEGFGMLRESEDG